MLSIYSVTVTHPDLDGPLILDLLASTPEAAAGRARLAGVHMYRHAELLSAAAEVTPMPCAGAADCDRPATSWTAHPVLGEIATCDRCATAAGEPAAATSDMNSPRV